MVALRTAAYGNDTGAVGGCRRPVGDARPAVTGFTLASGMTWLTAKRWSRSPTFRLGVAATATSLLLGLLIAANPAAADPGTSVPDTGARPVPAGAIDFPGQNDPGRSTPNQPQAPVFSPLAAQIMNDNATVELLGGQVTRPAGTSPAPGRGAAGRSAPRDAQHVRAAVEGRLAAADTFKRATALGPFASRRAFT
jgi:hypothetical protein